MISTANTAKKEPYPSPVEVKRKMAPLSLFGSTELVGLFRLNKSKSVPKVFVP